MSAGHMEGKLIICTPEARPDGTPPAETGRQAFQASPPFLCQEDGRKQNSIQRSGEAIYHKSHSTPGIPILVLTSASKPCTPNYGRKYRPSRLG